jgi:hypothetical protein
MIILQPEGGIRMAKIGISVARIEEIQRLVAAGHTDRFVARALKCRRTKVAEVRRTGAEVPASAFISTLETVPLWTQRVDWESVLKDVGEGFELKRIWEEKTAEITSYPNFWKQLHRRYPHLLKATVTLREFEPGTHCEVDYAGDRIEWVDRNGEVHEAHVFLGILCFSQLIFAWASSDEKSLHWLSAHQKMYAHFGGVPSVTVCDCLKNGVIKVHRYDPDLNPAYSELAAYYETAVVPARPRRPKDKALIENAVGLVMRLFRFLYRRRRFFSLAEVNQALSQVVERINSRPHTRFKTSRRQRWEGQEKARLKSLPVAPFEPVEWRTAKVHPDSTIAIESATYSVPHRHRGKHVRVKLTPNHVEIYLGLERLTMHLRDKNRQGARVILNEHLPLNAQAYREGTPQMVLSQARFVNSDLHALINELFQTDTLGHLRRAQGLVRKASEELQALGREAGSPIIAEAVRRMREYSKVRVSFFAETLTALKRQHFHKAEDREIRRLPNNPMLRNQPAAVDTGSTTSPQA